MQLTFTKRGGKTDDLSIHRADGSSEHVAAPKQEILPHDMIHYAVESCVPTPGFLSMVASGHPILFAAMDAQPGVEAVERLVETIQAEMWSSRVPATDLIALYEQTCAARDHDAVSVSAPQIAAIRAWIDALTTQWTALMTGETLTLDFAARPVPNR